MKLKWKKELREKKTMLALPDSGENTRCVVNIETVSSEQRHSAVKGKIYEQLLKQERPTAPPFDGNVELNSRQSYLWGKWALQKYCWNGWI